MPGGAGRTMSFIDENERFEAWLRQQCPVVEDDLKRKHRRQQDPFSFLRATFFRWSSQIEELCPDLKGAPALLPSATPMSRYFVHWRDSEARLVWGAQPFR